MSQIEAFTYILECADGTLYVGWTTDLERRLRAHNAGRGGRYTRGRRPVRLAYFEEHSTRQEARRREAVLRRLPRAAKLELITSKGESTCQAYPWCYQPTTKRKT